MRRKVIQHQATLFSLVPNHEKMFLTLLMMMMTRVKRDETWLRASVQNDVEDDDHKREEQTT